MKNTNKIELDKYYTPTLISSYCIGKVNEILGSVKFSDIIEPSAGNGSFSKQLDCIAYDIEPEDVSIIRQNFLDVELPYRKNRLVIGNPPFGKNMNLAIQFFKKSIQIADYIAFILPISQLNNVSSLFEFDLIHSEDLGIVAYSDRSLHCCFNIYGRNAKGLNNKKSNRLKSVTIIRQDSKGYKDADFDIRMCYWGNGSAGKILSEGETYSGEYKIKITKEFKQMVINVLSVVNWRDELRCIAMLKIQQFHIVNILKKYIPGIY